jgi:uncharacterized YigZ family protein
MDPVTPESDAFLVLLDGPEVELKVRGSRFIGQAFHAPDLEQVQARLAAVRKRHHAATHHCWAARFGGVDRLMERSGDDGEPSGTAGIPILKPLAGRMLHNGMVVVTRYYGGVKLGTGGLARAYSDATVLALNTAPVETVLLEEIVALTCSWDDMGTVEAILARAGRHIRGVERGFGDEPHFEITVRRSAAGDLKRGLVESTGGRVRFTS